MKTTDISVDTGRRYEFVSISDEVKSAVREMGVADGLCVIASTHTTAGITVNEDYDRDVGRDLAAASEALINALDVRFDHAEGNSDSHLLTSFFGQSQTLLLRGGELDLGRWQGIFLAEFDGPRSRTVRVSVLEG
ncbi:MAG: secondary thiamine-phosphate synthase enzyme YjbQ [Rubrobacteraceae bacterium]